MKKDKTEWLAELLNTQLDEAALYWFRHKILPLSADEVAKQFPILFGLTQRNIPATIPVLNPGQMEEAQQFYDSYNFDPLNLLQICRLLLIVKLPTDRNKKVLNLVFETGDINELVILYKGLYWLDNAPEFVSRLSEGIRTNMADVFDAIALSNPFPYHYLSEDAWNQMVLKAIFMGRPLYHVYKLHERKNQKLALILHDYIHERWAAGRTVSPELWQLMPGFVNTAIEADLTKASKSGDPLEQKAALKALNESSIVPDAINMTWEEIGKQINVKK